jgi:branched-chain amino acid transport system substrate-binding protein
MKKAMMKLSAAVLFFCWVLILPFLAYGDEVNIGVIMPLTGKVAAVGLDTLHGVQIAAKEINDAGGINVAGKNYKFVVREYDDEAMPAKSIAGLQLLKDRYNVPVVFMGLSGPTMACLQKNERLGILIMGWMKAPEATTQGNKLVLRTQQTADTDSRENARGVAKYFKAKTYAIISDISDWGKIAARTMEAELTKLGVKKVAHEWFDERTQTDFRGQLTKIKAANPDAIILLGHDESSAGIIIQANELGIKSPMNVSLGFGAVAEKMTGPKLIEGYMKRIEYTSKVPWPPAAARYRTKLWPAMAIKETPAAFGLNMYANVHIIARAMVKAGTTTDALKIRQAVSSVIPLPENINASGITAFSENGDATMPGVMGFFRNGKLVAAE